MYESLFSPSIWLPPLVLAVAAVIFVVGNNRVHQPTRLAGVGLAVVALVWIAAAYFVQTPVEQAVSRTKQIIASVEKSDWAGLAASLDGATTLAVLRGPSQISTVTQEVADRYGLKDITVLRTDAVVAPPQRDIVVTANTLVEGAHATTFRIQFTYSRRADGLLLQSIRPLEVNGQSLDNVQRYLPRP